MKKLLSLFCLFSLLTAFTCENEALDDGIESDTNNNSNIALIGTWSLEDFNVTLNTTTSFGGEEISSDIAIVSTEENYIVEFTQNAYTTNGNYTYDTNIIFNGEAMSADSYTLDNVSGGGTYSTNGNVMTINGSFFEFEFEGMDDSALQGEQTIDYQISADGQTLTFTQNETVTQNDSTTGTAVTNTTNSTSIWSRQ